MLVTAHHSGLVVSRGPGSEREGRKVAEYAQTGIPQYWIVDFDPRPKIQVFHLDGARYGTPTVLVEGDALKATEPYPVTFELSVLTDLT